jgi:hypothetical protein
VKEISEFPDFAVSEDGCVFRIRKAKTGRYSREKLPFEMPLHKNASGYLVVNLFNTQRLVHRLVAIAYLGSPPSLNHEAAHKNGDPSDNRHANLYWATAKDNARDRRDHGRTVHKLADADIEWIRSYPVRQSMFSEMARRLRVDHKTIRKAYMGHNYAHVPGAQPIPSFECRL